MIYLLSKYNILTTIDNKLIIYNTLSNGVLALNSEYTKAFNDLVENGSTDKNDLEEELRKGGMLYSEDFDELEKILILNKISSYNESSLSITIAPTSSCNFKCSYCYEKGIDYKTMSNETQNKLIEFLKYNYKNLSSIGVCWYGGEPLLSLNIIESLTNRIKEELDPNLKYLASIVTNGYYLNRETAEKLRDLGINQAQVTIDGSKKSHDNRRILHDGSPTFEHILNNIKNSYDLIDISIRMNIDKNNIDDMDEILDYLDKNNLKNKVGFYLATVDNINDTCNDCTCISKKEFSKEEIAFYEKAISNGFYCNRIPNGSVQGCGAISYNSLVVSPDGNLYKCWDDIGRKNKSIGSIYSGIEMNNNLIKWLSYNPIHDSECRECKFFPVCFGGCANIAFEKNSKNCATIKYNVEDTINLLYKMKKAK